MEKSRFGFAIKGSFLWGLMLLFAALFSLRAAAGVLGVSSAPASLADSTGPGAFLGRRSTDIYDAGGFVALPDVMPKAVYEIRNYTGYNFVGRRIDGFEEPIALLTREAAAALKEANDELLAMGYCFKIHDAYRPQRAVNDYIAWAQDPDDDRMKEFFYPDVEKGELFSRGYLARRSGHTRGSTVDLTLYDVGKKKEVDMGSPVDLMGEISHYDYAGITEGQKANRRLLREVMERHGFQPISTEWWHFRFSNEPYPDTYFNFPVKRSVLR